MVKKLISSAKNIVMEGVSGTVGFAGAGILGSAAENTAAGMFNLGAWGGAAVNAIAKFLVYHGIDRYRVPGVSKTAAEEGVAINLVIDLAGRLMSGGVAPAGPTLFGYNLLGGSRTIGTLSNPDLPGPGGDFTYSAPPSPAVARRQKRYGQMDESMATPGPLERQRRYGAMPYNQDPAKTARQRKYGAMEGMGFKPDAKDTSVARMFNMQ